MPRFPVDASQDKVIRCFERLGFRLVRKGNHIAMVRQNVDGSNTPSAILNLEKGLTNRANGVITCDYGEKIPSPKVLPGQSSRLGHLARPPTTQPQHKVCPSRCRQQCHEYVFHAGSVISGPSPGYEPEKAGEAESANAV